VCIRLESKIYNTISGLTKTHRVNKRDGRLYEKRKMKVEHPFGTVKRDWGYSNFLTTGLTLVGAENKLHFLAYNLKRLINIMGV